jgi:DNA-binding beta-propeller fold protein YncE
VVGGDRDPGEALSASRGQRHRGEPRRFVTGNDATAAYDASTGATLWFKRYSTGARRVPGGLAVSPDSSALFVTSASSHRQTNEHLKTTALDTTTGARIWTRSYANASPDAIIVSPGGSAVFVTGSAGTTPQYATVSYDAATGARLWAALTGSVGAPAKPASVAVSQTGSTVIVTGSGTAPNGESEYLTVAYRA